MTEPPPSLPVEAKRPNMILIFLFIIFVAVPNTYEKFVHPIVPFLLIALYFSIYFLQTAVIAWESSKERTTHQN